MKEKNFTALINYACPICGTVSDSAVAIHRNLRDISDIHQKTVDFGKHCDKCQEGIDSGAIMIIVVDESKSSGTGLSEIYRTGEVYGIKEEAMKKLVNNPDLLEDILRKRVTIMDYNTAKQVGLPIKYSP